MVYKPVMKLSVKLINKKLVKEKKDINSFNSIKTTKQKMK